MVEKHSVLLVRREADASDAWIDALWASGHHVCMVTGVDGKDWEPLLEHPPDLVLLDSRMPDPDALQLCRRLKGDLRTRDVSIVLVQDPGMPRKHSEWIRIGIADFIDRSANSAEMSARVRAHLSLRHARLELARQTRCLRMTSDELQSQVVGREQAESALRENAALLRSISSNMPNGMLYQIVRYADGRRRITFVSDAVRKFYGCSPEEAMADSDKLYGRILPEDFPRLLEEEEMAFRSFSTFSTEARVRNPDGSIRCSYFASSPRKFLEDATCWDGLEIDVTEQKRLDAQLLQAQKMDAIGQLAGGIAHDFNNQLVGIMGYADLLVDSLENPELKTYAMHILTSSQRAASLTAKLLSFARKGNCVFAPLNLHQAIAENVEMLRRSIDKRIQIATELEAPDPIVAADPVQIDNMLLNLAINARDAIEKEGSITFSTAQVRMDESLRFRSGLDLKNGEYLRLMVSDTGCGMDVEVKQHLFEPFFTTKSVGRGTGMGLASIYGTVKNHKGGILVESEAGCGTTVIAYFPLKGSTEQGSEGTRPAPNPARLRILAIDDEQLVREALCDMLREAGHEIATAENGRLGLELYRHRPQDFDLVILDLLMPEMSGHEAFGEMKKLDPNVRVLVVSGYSIDGEARSLLIAGAAGFLQKPFTRRALWSKIDKAMKF